MGLQEVFDNSAFKNFDENPSQKHLRTKVTPDLHLTYSKNGGNLGSESKRLKVKILDISP